MTKLLILLRNGEDAKYPHAGMSMEITKDILEALDERILREGAYVRAPEACKKCGWMSATCWSGEIPLVSGAYMAEIAMCNGCRTRHMEVEPITSLEQTEEMKLPDDEDFVLGQNVNISFFTEKQSVVDWTSTNRMVMAGADIGPLPPKEFERRFKPHDRWEPEEKVCQIHLMDYEGKLPKHPFSRITSLALILLYKIRFGEDSVAFRKLTMMDMGIPTSEQFLAANLIAECSKQLINIHVTKHQVFPKRSVPTINAQLPGSVPDSLLLYANSRQWPRIVSNYPYSMVPDLKPTEYRDPRSQTPEARVILTNGRCHFCGIVGTLPYETVRLARLLCHM